MGKTQTESQIPHQHKSDERKTIRPENPREPCAPGNLGQNPKPQDR